MVKCFQVTGSNLISLVRSEFVAKTNSNRPWIGFRFVYQNGAVKQHKPQRERQQLCFLLIFWFVFYQEKMNINSRGFSRVKQIYDRLLKSLNLNASSFSHIQYKYQEIIFYTILRALKRQMCLKYENSFAVCRQK